MSVVLIGCTASGPAPSKPVALHKPAPVEKKVVKARVTNRKANPMGTVLILEYHIFGPKESRYVRSFANFRKDLEKLYAQGYRPVTISEYLNDRMDLAPGASPVILSFDDSHISEFKMKPDGTIDPNCAVAVWKKFSDEHPDFPVKGSWYILPPYPWWQKKFYKKKIEMLKEWGSDFGSHSWSHPNFGKLSDDAVREQLGKSFQWLHDEGINSGVLCLPYGIKPKNKALMKGYAYGGKKYALAATLMCGSQPARAPKDPKRNVHRIPRVQVVELDYGMNYWLKLTQKGFVKPYVAP